MSNQWKKIGEIDVDSGLCWIGDPCYVLHSYKLNSIGDNWHEFCEKINDDDRVTAFSHNTGCDGAGLAVSSGYGDGTYPVYARFVGKRIAEVRVTFIRTRKE